MSGKEKDEVQDLLDDIEGIEPQGKTPAAKKKKAVAKKAPRVKPVIVGEVPISKLKFNDDNRDADIGAVAELKKSIENIGLMVPIVVNKKHEVLDGERRVRACMELGIKTVPFISAKTDFDVTTMIANYIRTNLSKEDAKDVLTRMQKTEGLTQKEIAERIGMTQSAVSKNHRQEEAQNQRQGVHRKYKRAKLPENVKMKVSRNKVELTFILDAEMMKTPEMSIVKLFKEIKNITKMVAAERA